MEISNTRKIFFYFISVLLAILVIEIGLQAINGVAHLLRKKQEDNPLFLYYQDKEMANQIWKETWEAINNREYTPFVEWAGKTYHGSYVNEDEHWGRKTWNPAAPAGQKLEQIFFMGGSAAWALGSRDEFTIPSYLSRILNRQGPRFQVINYGVPGYTFMQGLIHLVLMLKEGQRPGYVIFYDGFNEVYAAHQNGVAGGATNLFITRERLKWRIRDFAWNAIKESLNKYCMIYRAINGLYLTAGDEQKRFPEKAETFTDDQLRSLSREVVREYQQPMDFLDRLSKAYGFKYICFWQPNIFTEKTVMEKERRIDPRQEDKTLRKLCVYTNEYMQQEKIPHFYMLNDVLGKRPEAVYLDIAHISEKGNEIIAQSIYHYLQKDLLSQDPGGHGSAGRQPH